MIEKPQDTGCTSIEIDTGDQVGDERVANGLLTMIAGTRHVEYDEEADVYRVGEVK